MNRIHQLDADTANKIAAGEVVERPANVIKELVENSIDAKASKIDVLVTEGGMESMTIIDDGIGMSHEDALMCFSRHATSKIKDDHDLFNITTLGFRGEAIPSIASIAKFSLETNDGHEGSQVIYEFGNRTQVGYLDCPQGTKITVEKIFQNVPARLKYMKSVNAEFAAIYTYLERLALAHSEIAFSLSHNGREIFRTNGSGQLLEVIAVIYGMNVAKNMIPVDFGNEEVSSSGYVSNREITRASKNHIITLVNHRYVKNKKSIDAINDVYRQYLSDKRFPIAVINIEVDPYLVDVNVHPAKLEVRFSKEQELHDIITQGINAVLKPQEPAETIHQEPSQSFVFQTEKVQEEPFVFKEPIQEDVIELNDEPVYDQMTLDLREDEKVADEHADYQKEEKTSLKDLPQNPIKEKIYAKGQIRGSYIIGENERGMYLVDQHAALTRIHYERYKNAYQKLDRHMQSLLVPVTLEYTPSEFMRLEEHKNELKAVGIELEVMGPHTYCVRELPMWMDMSDPTSFIEQMIEQILSNQQLDVIELMEEAIKSLANQASIKDNTYLSQQAMQAILDDLMRCDNPYVDIKSHPTFVFYSDYELEKLFKKVN